MLSRKLSIFLTSLTLLFTASAWAAPAKILPLGDSITSDGNDAYRNELKDQLVAAGYDFEFVGTQSDGAGNHEGHSGWESNDILTHAPDNLTTWLQNYDVDVALIHLGTNDIINRLSNAGITDATPATNAQQTRTELEEILTKIKEKNNAASIFVAKILPLGTIKDANGNYTPTPPNLANDYSAPFNSLLTQAWAGNKAVSLVDQYGAGFTASNMGPLLIHPNTSGEELMAKTWFYALKAAHVLPPVLTLTPSATSTSGAYVFITFSSKSTGAINYSTDSQGICAVDPILGDVTPQAAGTCVIKASQAGDNSYAPTTKTVSITVTEVDHTVSFASSTPSNKTFGDDPFIVVANSFTNTASPANTGLQVNISVRATSTTICTIDANNKVSILKAGHCKLLAKAGGVAGTGTNRVIYKTYPDTSYPIQQIEIAKAIQTIKFNIAPPINKTFGDAPFSVTASSFNTKTPAVATGLTVDIGTTTANVCTYSATTKKVTIHSAGTCTIKAVQSGNDQYEAITDTISLSISAKGQTIAFPAIADKTINTAPFTISAIASSGLPVSFSSSTTNVCTIANKTVTLIATGTCRIIATAGNSNNSTASASREFEVTKVQQVVTFASNTPTEKTLKDAPFTVSASSTSGLGVSIQSSTSNVCTVSATNKVTILAKGSCVLMAQQAGDATYSAASETHTITITVANTTYDTVIEILNGNSNAATTVAQLKTIGLKNLNPNFDYTQALKKGNYKNKSKADVIKEMQRIIDLENGGNIETAGSVTLLWLLLFGLIGLSRRVFLHRWR